MTHSSILVWSISWTGEPGRLQSMGSQRVGPYLATDPQIKGSVLPVGPPTSDASHKSWVVTCALNLGSSNPSSGSVICYNNSQNPRKLFTFIDLLSNKGCEKGTLPIAQWVKNSPAMQETQEMRV